MKTKSIIILSGMGFLAACGGSSDGSAVNPTTPPPTVLNTFADGSGIARIETTSEGQSFTGTVVVPDVLSYQIFQEGDASTDFNSLTLIGTNSYGSFFNGSLTVNGVPIAATFYADNSGELVILYGATSTQNALVTLGDKVSNIPTSGTFTYNGTNVVGLRDGSYSEDGTFSMSVNFGTQRASISGSTATSTIGGTAIPVNVNDGTFSSSSIVLTDTLENAQYSGSLYGQLHGSGATGVTGVYHENASNPLVAGAIAGKR